METIEIIGYKRANLGKQNSKKLREEGNVPCVVYGGKEQIHFHSPMILFRDLVYTPGANFVKLNIEGVEKDAILQDISYLLEFGYVFILGVLGTSIATIVFYNLIKSTLVKL